MSGGGGSGRARRAPPDSAVRYTILRSLPQTSRSGIIDLPPLNLTVRYLRSPSLKPRGPILPISVLQTSRSDITTLPPSNLTVRRRNITDPTASHYKLEDHKGLEAENHSRSKEKDLSDTLGSR
ncbi:hypothetical protein MBM_09717 [Drepanopeziza brunnea f. sp. 'multigermtubi' MB_m1]|uniref:Uncharacterized protein n=1 Tax=Marssonina brunnea f. sp. multigermtubi (strain MB_m1) TaxID=1072389 RepID=K1WJ11_MARBU|nr:uncharacterized protein MBM_09717 [Drepanopeziza brunnea f. sp. 'multigermtubi' MB_m1]EKD12137.1 hypothetical protein MBM_09717 [Drepanopeziza brunnea f. sp. 'multigermtubi' MB_m1]